MGRTRRDRPLRALALTFAVAAAPAGALDPALEISQYVHQRWRAPQALPHDNVSALAQTRDGYLWVGTVEGLARFDGARAVTFDRSNTPELADNWIKALLEDRGGRLWIASYGGGLASYEGGRFRRWSSAEGLAAAGVLTSLLEDRSGRIWLGGLGGLHRLEGERFVAEEIAGRAPVVKALHEDRSGTLWVGTAHGLYRRLAGAWQRVEEFGSEVVNALASTADGLWIGTEKRGLARLDGGRLSRLGPAEGLAHFRVWTLAVDGDGALWIGTDGGGLQRLHAGRLSSFASHDGLANDYVWAILEDREGGVWVGTNGGGLHRFSAGRVVPWTTREGLPSDFTWAVGRDGDGALLVGSEETGLARRVGERFERLRWDGPPDSAKSFVLRRDGTLWVGGHRGLWVRRGDVLVRADLPGLAEATVNALAEARDGTLWIATNSNGLLRLTGRDLERVGFDDEAGGAAVSSVLPVRDGSVWAGTMAGAMHLRDGALRLWTLADGLPSAYVTDLFEGTDGAVWIATRGGLARWQDGRLAALTAAHGLVDDAIMVAQPDRAGGVWLGGNRGLARVDLAEAEAVLAGRRERLTSLGLGPDDGLPSVEINGAGNSSFEDVDGRLWFATRGGVAAIDPAGLAPDLEPPPVRIEEVTADGVRVDGAAAARLAPGVRRIVLRFTTPTFDSIDRIRFRFRLEGFDPDWIEARTGRSAEYTNLEHGRYRFRVVAADRDGIWSEEEATFEFVVLPHWWETLAFRAAVVLFFLVAGPVFYLRRVRSLRSQRDRLERQVAERTAEIEAANVRLAELASRDALTGLANRRTFDETLETEWRRAERLGLPLALLMIDVDEFKAFNDAAGHPAGDACLQAVAAALAALFRRAGELVVRYGGEEFAVLLPALARDEAATVAAAARAHVAHLALPHRASSVAPVVTVSIGVAWAEPSHGKRSGELVADADRALYRAKQNGRNRVEVA